MCLWSFEELSDRFGVVESRLCEVEKYQSDALSTPGSSNERKKRKLLPSVNVSCGVLMFFFCCCNETVSILG